MLVNLHDRSKVLETVHVFRSRPDCGQFIFEQKLVTLLAQLMGSCEMSEIIKVKEFVEDLLAEDVACFSWRLGET